MVKRHTDDDIEEMPMTRLAVDSSLNDTPVTGGHGRTRRNVKTILITLGAVLTPIGIGLFWFSYKISAIDTYSVTVVLSEDRMGHETLAEFRFTSWREPSASIRPFVHGPKSFEGCEILRYRRGSKLNGLFRYAHYEAEYRMPDGSLVVGPAFGPRPYTAPNLLVFVPLIGGGLAMLVAGIALKSKKLPELEPC